MSDLTQFDRKLVFDRGGPPDSAHDPGQVMTPKLCRRRSTFGIALIAKMAPFFEHLPSEIRACLRLTRTLVFAPPGLIG